VKKKRLSRMLKTSTSLEVDRPIERLKRINEEIYSEEIRFLEWAKSRSYVELLKNY